MLRKMNRPESIARADSPAASARAGRIGVLIVNLGTPDATDAASVRRYLREFLSDARVIENQGLVWKFVLNAIILPRRPRVKGRDYEKIWNRERNESPLKTITRAQAAKLRATIEAVDPTIMVDWAMRYGNPSMRAASKRWPRPAASASCCCRSIRNMPRRPARRSATSRFATLAKLRDQPALRVVPPYYDEPVYIEALANSIETALKTLPVQPELILASFHGIPKSYVDDGDPYPSHCAETVRLLRERMKLDETKLMLTFQSRFGKAEWLQPYTDKTVEALARRGVKSLAVVTPGFSADCLETLEEIAVENGDIFKANGGENFAAIPCLNDSEAGMAVISHLVLRELQGWI